MAKYSGEAIAAIELSFHDEWAASMNLDELDVYAAFTAVTTPEFRFAVESLGALHDKHILDLGCGPGESSIYLVNQGARVTAIDISPGMIQVGRELAKRFEIGEDRLTFIKMSAENLEFEDGAFDLLFGSNVMHHCNTEKVSREVSRVLKPGGRAVFIDPLGYNPVIEVYRRMAYKVRTPTEHPLVYKDVRTIQQYFKTVTHKEFQLTTLLIFLWIYLVERVHPSEERYWRKYVLDGDRYAKAFLRLNSIDQFLMKWIPFSRRLCWVIVTMCAK
jgi:ubiquinone/menaquinone biosynthesis C-methylase UbiE